MRTIMSNLTKASGGWPKKIGGNLFFCDRETNPESEIYPVDWLSKTSSLFGWLGVHLGTAIDFAKVPGSASKDEVFAELQRSAEKFDMVDSYPHQPPIPGVYYACPEKEKWISKRPGVLNELVARFCPQTSVDAELIKAMILTLFWGGSGGRRPLFVITADSGRGAGKTTFVELLTSLCGGCLQLSSNADDEIIRQRLLSPEGMEKRVVLLDNVKSLKFSWAELEALITSEQISGKRMYVGEGSRPNFLTYIMTINGPAFSTDLAQRSVTIKLARPSHTGNWYRETANFIHEHRVSIIAEILEILAGPKNEIHANTRWGDWENNVLATSGLFQECQDQILVRQQDLDVEQEESQMILDQIENQLSRKECRPQESRIFIGNELIVSWVNYALGDRMSKLQVIRMLTQRINEGRLPRLEKSKYAERVDGKSQKERGFWWTGVLWREEDGTQRPGNLVVIDPEDKFLFT